MSEGGPAVPISYTCAVCGETHVGLPDIGFDRPWYWRDELVDDPDSRLTADLCVIEGRDHFIRCVLEVPIAGAGAGVALGWGVWLSQSRANFDLYAESLAQTEPAGRESVGYLSNRLPGYPDTLALVMKAHWRRTARPLLEPQPVAHPLAADWRTGISLERALGFVMPILHPGSDRSRPAP